MLSFINALLFRNFTNARSAIVLLGAIPCLFRVMLESLLVFHAFFSPAIVEASSASSDVGLYEGFDWLENQLTETPSSSTEESYVKDTWMYAQRLFFFNNDKANRP